MTSIGTPICLKCEHYNADDQMKMSCKAFPRGIPKVILEENIHDKPLKKQGNDLIFKEEIDPYK
jgi:hypothetical protein